MQVDTFASRELLNAGQAEEAIQQLSKSVLPAPFRNNLLLVNAEWEASERSFSQNLIDYQQFARERSRLTMALMELLDQMENAFFEASTLDKSLHFFEGGNPLPDHDQRKYGNEFEQQNTRFVYWELRLVHPAAIGKLGFDLAYEIYRPDQTLLTRQEGRRFIEPGWANAYFSNGWGKDTPGSFPPGTYTVKKYLNGREVAQGVFTIK